jgi:hypothetical protein
VRINDVDTSTQARKMYKNNYKSTGKKLHCNIYKILKCLLIYYNYYNIMYNIHIMYIIHYNLYIYIYSITGIFVTVLWPVVPAVHYFVFNFFPDLSIITDLVDTKK